MIRTDRLLVCEFSHLTATPSCAIMLTLGKIGQNPILSQYGRPLYHIRLPLSIYFFHFLPGIFPGIFIAPIPFVGDGFPVPREAKRLLYKNTPPAEPGGRRNASPTKTYPRLHRSRGHSLYRLYFCGTLDKTKQLPSAFSCRVITIFVPLG